LSEFSMLRFSCHFSNISHKMSGSTNLPIWDDGFGPYD